MIDAETLIEKAKSMHIPDAGIIALTDVDHCLMNERYCRYPYKDWNGCPDHDCCDDPEYLMICLATLEPNQLATWVTEVYSDTCPYS